MGSWINGVRLVERMKADLRKTGDDAPNDLLAPSIGPGETVIRLANSYVVDSFYPGRTRIRAARDDFRWYSANLAAADAKFLTVVTVSMRGSPPSEVRFVRQVDLNALTLRPPIRFPPSDVSDRALLSRIMLSRGQRDGLEREYVQLVDRKRKLMDEADLLLDEISATGTASFPRARMKRLESISKELCVMTARLDVLRRLIF